MTYRVGDPSEYLPLVMASAYLRGLDIGAVRVTGFTASTLTVPGDHTPFIPVVRDRCATGLATIMKAAA